MGEQLCFYSYSYILVLTYSKLPYRVGWFGGSLRLLCLTSPTSVLTVALSTSRLQTGSRTLYFARPIRVTLPTTCWLQDLNPARDTEYSHTPFTLQPALLLPCSSFSRVTTTLSRRSWISLTLRNTVGHPASLVFLHNLSPVRLPLLTDKFIVGQRGSKTIVAHLSAGHSRTTLTSSGLRLRLLFSILPSGFMNSLINSVSGITHHPQ